MRAQQSAIPALGQLVWGCGFRPPSHPRQPLHMPIGQRGCLSAYCTPPPNSLSGRRVLARRSLRLGAGPRRWKVLRPLHRSGSGPERGGILAAAAIAAAPGQVKESFFLAVCPTSSSQPKPVCLLRLSCFGVLVRAVKPPTLAPSLLSWFLSSAGRLPGAGKCVGGP